MSPGQSCLILSRGGARIPEHHAARKKAHAACQLQPLFRFTSPARLPSLTCCALPSFLFPLGPLGWGSPCLPLRHVVTSVTLSPPTHPVNSCLPASAPPSFHCLLRQGQALAWCYSASPFVTPHCFSSSDDPLWAIAATRKSSSSFASLLKTACQVCCLTRSLSPWDPVTVHLRGPYPVLDACLSEADFLATSVPLRVGLWLIHLESPLAVVWI